MAPADQWGSWSDEEKQRLFTSLTSLLVNSDSVLRTLMMYGYHTVLYDISFTDLDEVSEAMQSVVDGLRFFIAGI